MSEPTLCGCKADSELCWGTACTACGHRDHGKSGCQAIVPVPLSAAPAPDQQVAARLMFEPPYLDSALHAAVEAITAPDERVASLPDYITTAVLDQWEASARRDEALGAAWSLNPTTVLAILPVLRAAKESGPKEPKEWDDHAVDDRHPCRVCGRVTSHDHDSAEWNAAKGSGR